MADGLCGGLFGDKDELLFFFLLLVVLFCGPSIYNSFFCR